MLGESKGLVKYDAIADGGERPVRKKQSRSTAPKLYNLAADIGEAQDQTAAHPEKAAELHDLWEKWNAEQARPLWGR